jgi:C-terminal processing protease CtpA/Prc
VSVPRHKKFYAAGLSWRSGEVVRILDGNIGYVDLDRLNVPEVDAMFEKLKDTRAIIFDMRGYPHATAWAIAPRLNVRHATDAAMFERPIVGTADWTPWRHKFIQPLPTSPKPLYRGKTFMLVDERTISQSEHTGLFFEVAAGTRFVGSQSAGANGDVTNIALPGGLSVTFTGHDVRHADGRQLQRVGLPLDVRVTPTLRGVQAGRDEVLDRALQVARAAK